MPKFRSNTGLWDLDWPIKLFIGLMIALIFLVIGFVGAFTLGFGLIAFTFNVPADRLSLKIGFLAYATLVGLFGVIFYRYVTVD